jgi:hypothetical protein
MAWTLYLLMTLARFLCHRKFSSALLQGVLLDS